MSEKLFLGSDNNAPAHPIILDAVVEANHGYALAYGNDEWTKEVEKLFQETFRSPCKVLMAPNGTGSNILALKIACKRYESILCSNISHIQYQESGAVESIIGCKLLNITHKLGKVTPQTLLEKLKKEKAFGKHSTVPKILSLTEPTELGTLYTLKELRDLSDICKQENLLLHIDGSRFYNAIVALKTSFAEIIQVARPDILSLGGTKNGLMGAESVIIFNENLKEGSEHLHKQTLQLSSKMRYLSAQYIPFFKQNIWYELALQANTKAKRIASIIQQIPELFLSWPVETNQIFFQAPASWIPVIQEKIHCYLWEQEKNEIRLIASWCTTDEDLDKLEKILKSIKSID